MVDLSRTHKTVTIVTPDFPKPRDFHIVDKGDRIQRFVAKVEAEGGTATVGPYKPGPELQAMLADVFSRAGSRR